jgi:two-component system, chemotaxis family, sensor kinase Cph1
MAKSHSLPPLQTPSMLATRDQLTEEELKEALDACAQEPIHIPGSIQPHGMLAVISASGIIERISANAVDFTGREARDCLGKAITECFPALDAQSLQRIQAEGVLQPIQSLSTEMGGRRVDIVAHKSGSSTIIELETVPEDGMPNEFYYDQLRHYSIGMHKAKTIQEVCDHVVHSIRRITGFDRVNLYKFDQDWHGEVLAESRTDLLPSYKGLHFPASDIPEQARRLYMQNYLRLIANTQYKPVPVIPAGKTPLDMSQCTLRSVSPVHIQYLDNINVRASMSVSIIQNGELWGLIACHHSQPLHLTYLVRNICETMGHIFSVQLSMIEDITRRKAQARRDELVRELACALERETRLEQLVEEVHQLAIDALEADGLVVKAFVHVFEYGDTPGRDLTDTLFDWLKSHIGGGIFYTSDAASYFKGVPVLESLIGGILAVPISMKSQDYILWFRKAIVKEVVWAGDPEKPVEQTPAGYRLTPRRSFELWKQQVSHRSKSWSLEDIQTARSVVNVLLESEKLSAQQANLAKTEFLANMSHEIRTPMNAIIGLSRILSGSNPLTDKQREIVNTLQISCDTLLALINDLLDISKIESRNLDFEMIPFSMSQLIQEVISMMSVKALEKGLKFSLESDGVKNRTYTGDPSRIRQILMNLCSNAIKFTDRGGIDIFVLREPAAEKGLEKICIEVRDTGIGIPPEKVGTVFQKFVQADNSISRRYGGTGLGLAITKMLTEAMGGEISVESELGKGSTFTVCFYLKISAQAAAESDNLLAQASPVAKSRPRVLIVEDYEPDMLVAATCLENSGYECDVARNGIEAVEKANEGEYIAILMDGQIPGINGFEASQIIRGHEKSHSKPRVPIIGMTAHAMSGDRERCLAAGMDDYIPKPVNEEDLTNKLRMLVK